MKQLLQLWTGPLPHQELHPDRNYNPLVHWVFHPLKRHIARLYLQLLQNIFGLKVIAITGSAGKTTTKELLHSILKWSGPTVSTVGNITPTYNIPAAILNCSLSTRYLILEMGVEYPGDMDFYTWLARPDISVITCVNRTHTSYLGSIADVASEKGKIAKLADIAIINSDDPNIKLETNAQIKYFGHHESDYCQIKSAQITPDFKTQIELFLNQKPALPAGRSYLFNLPLLGEHFASDTAAAATVASLLEVKPQMIIHGLQTVTPPPHRLQIINKGNSIIIDDAYNANPLAVKSSLDVLHQLAEITHLTPVFVFGQMNELGQYEQSAHEEIGEYIKKLGVKNLYTTGAATKFTLKSAGFGQYFESKEAMLDQLGQLTIKKYIILLKASRNFHFEDLIDALVSSKRS